MKYEPLKGKVLWTYWIEIYEDKEYIYSDAPACIFDFDDVKSAVQGLLQEIDKEIEEAELEKEGKGYYRFFDNVMTLKRAKSLIKKWLPDVVEGEE